MNWDFLHTILQKICITIATFCIAFFANTTGFLIAFMLAFGMHILAGMGADKVKLKWRWGVPPAYLENFKVPKMTIALIELALIVSITYFLKGMVDLNNYEGGSHYVVQFFFAIASYYYITKGLKNLIKRFPKIVFLRIVLAVLTFKFKEIIGEQHYAIIEKEMQTEIKKQNNNEQTN